MKNYTFRGKWNLSWLKQWLPAFSIGYVLCLFDKQHHFGVFISTVGSPTFLVFLGIFFVCAYGRFILLGFKRSYESFFAYLKQKQECEAEETKAFVQAVDEFVAQRVNQVLARIAEGVNAYTLDKEFRALHSRFQEVGGQLQAVRQAMEKAVAGHGPRPPGHQKPRNGGVSVSGEKAGAVAGTGPNPPMPPMAGSKNREKIRKNKPQCENDSETGSGEPGDSRVSGPPSGSPGVSVQPEATKSGKGDNHSEMKPGTEVVATSQPSQDPSRAKDWHKGI